MIKIDEVHQAQEKWANYVVNEDLENLLNLYHSKAVLKPTLSNAIRSDRETIKSYFIGDPSGKDKGFLNNHWKKVNFLANQHIEILDRFVSTSGVYEFENGSNDKTSAHFTFIYEKDGHDLLIRTQHSSLFV